MSGVDAAGSCVITSVYYYLYRYGSGPGSTSSGEDRRVSERPVCCSGYCSEEGQRGVCVFVCLID